MEERATGLILRTYPLTESSLIVHWFTVEQGRLKTVAKGARQIKSAFRGKIDLFFQADFIFLRSRRSELHTLKELVVRATFPELRRELSRLQKASYCAALVEKATEIEAPAPEIYELLRGLLSWLPQEVQPTPVPIFAFEIKLLAACGWRPNLGQSALTEGSLKTLELAAVSDWAGAARLHPSPAQTAEIRAWLGHFLKTQLDWVPESRDGALDAE